MSLMQLLAVGKSLIGLKGETARYKMVEQNLLPKFAPLKKEMAQQPLSSAALSSCRSPLLQAALKRSEIRPATTDLAEPLATDKKMSPRNPVLPEQSVSNNHPVEASLPKRRSIFKNPFFAKSAMKAHRELVQGELALDTVKVVRNDLSEADVEVVASRIKAESKVEANHAQSVPTVEATAPGIRWSRLAARLCESGPSRV